MHKTPFVLADISPCQGANMARISPSLEKEGDRGGWKLNNIRNLLPVVGARETVKPAFTLAEVLITLAIIGIVAALTIPTLLTNLSSRESAVKLRKAYSVLSQAIRYMTANDETIVNVCATNDSHCLGEYFNKYIKFVIVREGMPENGDLKDCWSDAIMAMHNEPKYCGVTADGVSYNFDMEFANGNGNRIGLIFIDVNGISKPNVFGKDRYVLQITADGQLSTKVLNYKQEDYPCDYGRTQGDSGYYNNTGCAHFILKNISNQ